MSGHSHADARPILIPALSLLAVNLSEPHFLTLDTVGCLPEPQASLPCRPGLLPSLMVLTEPLGILSVWEGIETHPKLLFPGLFVGTAPYHHFPFSGDPCLQHPWGHKNKAPHFPLLVFEDQTLAQRAQARGFERCRFYYVHLRMCIMCTLPV